MKSKYIIEVEGNAGYPYTIYKKRWWRFYHYVGIASTYEEALKKVKEFEECEKYEKLRRSGAV